METIKPTMPAKNYCTEIVGSQHVSIYTEGTRVYVQINALKIGLSDYSYDDSQETIAGGKVGEFAVVFTKVKGLPSGFFAVGFKGAETHTIMCSEKIEPEAYRLVVAAIKAYKDTH